MNIQQMQHIEHELGTWKRALDYIQQENIFLKHRLAEIIKEEIDTAMLEQVEYFQNQFLNKDAIVALLRYDIAAESKDGSDMAIKKNVKKHEKLRKDMDMLEKEFNKLKFDFNNYFSQVLHLNS